MNLTAIKNAPEGSELHDDEIPALQLRVRNGNKAFFLYYRHKATGQRRRPKIGDFPSMTLATAREIAREWLGEVARGKDPSGERSALRASETVSSLCDRYLKETEGRASHRHDKGRVKNTLKPEWGTKRVPEVTKADVHELRRKMRNKKVAYNRMAALISQMWKFAGIDPPPTKGVDRYPERKRVRYFTPDERDRFLAALAETEIQYPHACALIRVLYLTGARFSEIAKAKRSQYRDGSLYLAKHKTADKKGAKVIPFNAPAREAINNIDARNGALTGFASGPWAAWTLIRDRAGLKDFTLHDLRHNYATVARGLGHRIEDIGDALGHADRATTMRYAHPLDDHRSARAEEVGAELSRPPSLEE